jgi:hypothetical protein
MRTRSYLIVITANVYIARTLSPYNQSILVEVLNVDGTYTIIFNKFKIGHCDVYFHNLFIASHKITGVIIVDL